MIDERTELLINRRLDGELSEDESLELNKSLIRSPDARRLLDEYERNDAAAADALDAFLRPEVFTPQPHGAAEIVQHRGWASRLGIGVRAVAAALLLATMIQVPSYWRNNSSPANATHPGASILSAAGTAGAPLSLTSDPLAVEGPREETQRLHRNVVGVWDEETQSVYVLELDQCAQRVVPVSRNF